MGGAASVGAALAPSGRVQVLAMVAILTTAVTPPAVADAGPAPGRELTFQVGSGLYAIPGPSALGILWGPKVTVEYGRSLGEILWLDLGMGLTGGSCMFSAEEGCVLMVGSAVEPFAGFKWKTSGGGPWVGYAKLVAGVLLMAPDRPTSYGRGVTLREGGGFRYLATRNVGLGVELTGVLGLGEFYVESRPQNTIKGFDVAFGMDARF
jgi:hypothetical protein